VRCSASAGLVALAALLGIAGAACASRDGDQPANNGAPPAAGKDLRVRDVTDPTRAEHPSYVGNSVAVSGAAVTFVDTFDETGNGKSSGTIYVQDMGSKEPYSGTSLFAPSFIPGNLKVGPGDVLDLKGVYQENGNIGTAKFAAGAVLQQLARPTATFRLELASPTEPVEIDGNDLADFAKGRRWLNMLVTVKNVRLYQPINRDEQNGGRLSSELLPKQQGAANACDAPFPKPPTLTNELFDLGSLDIPAGTTVASITGLVVFFCNLHIAPRSAADIVR
jgi:hypothetical protein